MISILRPSTPPLALISSAAIWAACGIDAPAIACASAITPILMGSAAWAWPEAVARRPSAVAPSSFRTDQKPGDRDVLAILFLSTDELLFCRRHSNHARARGKRKWDLNAGPRANLSRWASSLMFPFRIGSRRAPKSTGGTLTNLSPHYTAHQEKVRRRGIFAEVL